MQILSADVTVRIVVALVGGFGLNGLFQFVQRVFSARFFVLVLELIERIFRKIFFRKYV